MLDPLVAKGDIKIVMDQFTPDWKTEPAQANAENALTANDNKVDAFLVSYDGMSLGVLQAIEAAGIEPGTIPVTGQDMELAAAQAIVEGRQFGSLWPAPDEMAVRRRQGGGRDGASARTSARPTTIDNGAGRIPWVKTPIYLVSQDEMADFVCTHQHWLKSTRSTRTCRTRSRPASDAAGGSAACRPAEVGAAATPVLRRPRGLDQALSRACWRSTASTSRSRRARSSRCSARTAPASRR